MNRFHQALLALTICICAGTVFGQDAETAPKVVQRRPLVEAKTLTLAEMSKAADIIFRGQVKKVEEEDRTIEGKLKNATVHVYKITFKVESKLKGDVGDELVVQQLPTAYTPLKEGDEVLWYLSKPGKSGFTAPMGLYSGNFKIETDPGDPKAKIARNLVNNKGLWGSAENQNLFTNAPDKVERMQTQFMDAVNKAALPDERVSHILQLSRKPNRPGPLPVELVTSATETLLSVPME